MSDALPPTSVLVCGVPAIVLGTHVVLEGPQAPPLLRVAAAAFIVSAAAVLAVTWRRQRRG